jgi:hypothetical protein
MLSGEVKKIQIQHMEARKEQLTPDCLIGELMPDFCNQECTC